MLMRRVKIDIIPAFLLRYTTFDGGAAKREEVTPELLASKRFGPEWWGPKHQVRLSSALKSSSTSLMAEPTLALTVSRDSLPAEGTTFVSSLPENPASSAQDAQLLLLCVVRVHLLNESLHVSVSQDG